MLSNKNLGDNMKKYLIIIILITSIFIALLSIGCEKQRVKNEIIQFDREYYEVVDHQKYRQQIDDINNNHEMQKWDECERTLKELMQDQERFISEFRKLSIPEPFDDFYHIKIQQLDYFRRGNLIWLFFYENNMNTFNDKDYDRSEDYFKKADDLWFESDKIRREVYREYGLDDLIYKWQE